MLVEGKYSHLTTVDEWSLKSVKAIKSREEYIISEAFAVVEAIVGSFNSTTTTSVEQKIDGKPIAPGMTLFIGVENNSFLSNNFFPDYDEKFNKLADRAELMTKRMDVITKKISEFNTIRLEADKMACRQIVEQMQTKRLALAGVANGSHRRKSF